MDTAVSIFVFILGTIVGSFLNVVIFRYNTGRSIVSGRSVCMTCDRKLEWYNMLPLLSFTIQKGRCARCYSRISPQYFFVEFLTAVIFLALYFKFDLTLWFPFYSVIFSILIIIAVYDFRHKIIPDGLSYLLVILALLKLVYIYLNVSPAIAISSLKSGLLAFVFLGSFWLVSSGKWMGFGDAKLALGLGLLNSFCFSLSGLFLSFWVGAVIGILTNVFVKKVKEVPFAPFLILGFTLVFFFDINLFYYLGEIACIK